MFARKYVALVVGLGLTACGPKVASIDVQPSKVTLNQKGQVAKLTATPKDGEGKAVENIALTWTSSDPAVATVDAASGSVTAVKTGDAVIKIAFQDKVTQDVPVQVSLPASISVAPAEITLGGVGQSARISAKVLDENGRLVTEDVVWENSNPEVATISKGEVTAMGVGSAQLYATAAGVRAPVKVTVAAPEVASIEVQSSLELKAKKGAPIQLAAVGKDADGNAVSTALYVFESADSKIATVDAAGLVTPVAKGKTKVTVTSGPKSAVVDVVVK